VQALSRDLWTERQEKGSLEENATAEKQEGSHIIEL
jgi:hypothetical protein